MLHIKLFLALLSFAMAYQGIASAQSQSSLIKSADPAKFEFALIGDIPYRTSDYPKFDRVINAINADNNLKWVLHAGDIKSGSSPCTDEIFHDRLKRFQRFNVPFILTPGDNEWTDCHRAAAGSYSPLERLARLREVFYPKAGETLGKRSMAVTSQASDPEYSEFVENVRWMKNHVMFATLHIVGSNNGLAPFSTRTKADNDEVARRTAANLSWLKQTFEEALTRKARGVFLLFQANPNFELNKKASKRRGFNEILEALEQESIKFGKPVILAHGDTHHFKVDKPLFNSASNLPLENVTRVETFGYPNVHWVRVIVDPYSAEVFTIHQEIIEQNLNDYPMF